VISSLRIGPPTRGGVAAVAVLALIGAAHADVVTYASHGSAATTDGDARTRALDAAFASAVTEAVADLAGKNARTQAAAVDREIVRRARRYVASFAVTTERPGADRVEVDVDVRIDRDKVRARLLELGVVLIDAPPVEPSLPAVQPRAATVLYRVTGVAGVQASFGVAATADLPGVDALTAAVAQRGYRAVAASAAGPAPDADGELPVDDDSARALAADVQADAALVVGVAVGAPGAVRGTPLTAVPVRAWLRLVEVRGGGAPTAAAIATAAWGNDGSLALAAATKASRALVTRAFGAAPAPVDAAAAPPLVAARGVTVRVVGPGAWQAAALVRADLAAAPGASAVGVAGVGADVVALAVDGLAVDKAASIAKATPGFSAKTKVIDGVVVVQIKAIGAP
jgi:hypothetical protein